jgi:hypothetical protein
MQPPVPANFFSQFDSIFANNQVPQMKTIQPLPPIAPIHKDTTSQQVAAKTNH